VPEVFGLDFHSEVGPQQLFEVQESQRYEHVLGILTHEAGVLVVRLSRVQHLGVVRLKRHEGVTELGEPQFPIAIFIVSRKEQLELIFGRAEAELIDERVVEFGKSEAAPTHLVEDLESVEEVEIGVLREVDLLSFDEALLVDELHEGIQQVLSDLPHDNRLIHLLFKLSHLLLLS